MIRRFCDGCGLEVPEEDVFNVFTWEAFDRDFDPDGKATWWGLDRIKVRVIVDVDGTSNAGEVCATCVKKIVAQGTARRFA